MNKKLINVSQLAAELGTNRTTLTAKLAEVDLKPFIDDFLQKAADREPIEQSIFNITELAKHLGISQVACRKKSLIEMNHKFSSEQVNQIKEIFKTQL